MKAEDEGGGGEHLPRDLLAYSSAKGGHQQQRSRLAAIFTGTTATASGWSTPFLCGG